MSSARASRSGRRPRTLTAWSSTPPWDPSWGEHEVRDEECCWVCWAALSLTTSFRTEFLALLCPDSAHKRAGRRGSLGSGWQEGGGAAAHPKNAILVLYCGSLLLTCNTEHTIDDVKAKIQDKQGIPQDQRHSSLESSSSMAPRCRTTTSRGRALFTLVRDLLRCCLHFLSDGL
jgi:hypothetical protein